MIPYRKFSDTLKGELCTPAPSKSPKAPKVGSAASTEARTLDDLGALGAHAPPRECCNQPAGAWTEAQEEPAAIIEYDGGVPRAWAEGFARLDAAKPPADVPAKRWTQFIDDCGKFLDSGWAARAAALGWGPLNLFSSDRERPFTRIDHAGLLWLLNGRRLLALTGATARIATKTGNLTYYRMPVVAGQVILPWELRD